MNRSFPLRRAASARPHPVFPCRVLLGAVLLAFGGLAPVQADDGLVVVGYGGAGQKAQEVAFFQPFTQQTGIPVVQSEYNGEMARIKVMADTGHADWDLVQVEGPDLARGCDDGLFERLDWQAIGGKQQLIANAAQECGSAALVWGVAIGYDADRLQQPPASWADFWDVQRFPGKRGLRKRAIYNLEFALLADGVPREQVYPLLATRAGADRAFAKLGQLKPYIQWWEGPSPGPASRQGVSERRRGDHPEHQGIAVARVAVAMRFLAGVAEAVALAELEMAVADPEFEDSAEDVAGFLALMAVALLAVGARRETRVEDLQLAAGLRGEQFVDDAVFVMHAHARVAPHHVAGVRRVHRGLAGEEPLDGHAEAAGDVEQRRNRRIRQVAFQLADVAGGEFALCGQLGQGQGSPSCPGSPCRPRPRPSASVVSARVLSASA